MTELHNNSSEMLSLRSIYSLAYNLKFLYCKIFKYTESFMFFSRVGILRRGCMRTLHRHGEGQEDGGGKMAKKTVGGKFWSLDDNRDRFKVI